MTTSRAATLPRIAPAVARIEPGALGAWLLGFALLAYVGLKGGGYDVVVRTQVGLAVWWIVGLGALGGVLGGRRMGKPLVAVAVLLAAFAAWTLLSASWSESSESAVSEAARDLTLLGVFLLAALGVQRTHRRHLVHGILAAIVLVAGLACLSRLHPAWFSTPETGQFLPRTSARLSYGLNYWNALAAFAALGVPLALAVSLDARTAFCRALACAAIPVLVLTAFLTLSRGGILAGGIGLLVALALTPDRVRWLGNALLASVGSAILVKGALQRDALRNGTMDDLARHQGSELLVIALVVLAGIVLVHLGVSFARQGALVPTVRTRRWAGRARLTLVLVTAAVAVVIFLSAGGPHRLSHSWERFKNPQVEVTHADSNYARLGSASGNGRYQYWVSATKAFDTQPLHGIGAGSFETWWARQATLGGHVVNAHSLYMETLAELGFVGVLLLGGLLLVTLGTGAARAIRGAPRDRALVAGATAASAAFVVSAGVDWMWQVTVLPATFLLLAVVVLAPSDEVPRVRRAWVRRAGVPALAIVAIVASMPALAVATQLRASQRAAVTGRLGPALEHADGAKDVQPYALSPLLQRALVLEARGNLAEAATAAATAARNEPTNWRAPFILARVEGERGRVGAAVAAYRRAKRLNRTASFLR